MWQTLRLVALALWEKRILGKRPEEILALQQQRARSLVAWAKERSPFYAERLKHIDLYHFDLHDLPTLTKTEMMQNFVRVVTDQRLRLVGLEEFVRAAS